MKRGEGKLANEGFVAKAPADVVDEERAKLEALPGRARGAGRIAERYEEILLAREPLGWRLGLERMRRLCSLLGMPQNRFASSTWSAPTARPR